MRSWFASALAASLLATVPAVAASQERAVSDARSAPKSRLFVLTDIEADPDDTQSLVRLLLYSNEIDLEGLVATTSVHQKNRITPESIRRVIGEYAKVRANVALHAPAFPAAATLYRLVGSGQPVYGMAGVGSGKSTEGSRDSSQRWSWPDPRPCG